MFVMPTSIYNHGPQKREGRGGDGRSSYFKSASITRIFNVSHDKILQLNPHFWLRKCPTRNCGISRHLAQLARLSQNFEYRDSQPVPCPYSALKRFSSPTATLYCSSSSKQHYRVASHFLLSRLHQLVMMSYP